MAADPITRDTLKAELLESAREERDISDIRYAPMIVKTIVFGLIGSIAVGVVMGIGNLVINGAVEKLKPQELAILEKAQAI